MAQSFYFYDLETTGVNPREGRIMQFAGQRTDMNLQPVGEPHNVLIKIHDDVLPEPDAVLLTGITPQQTITDGLTEAEFLYLFYDEIATPDTIFLGYNTVRFDDEFMRFLHYRNYYDPYEWQWSDKRSRWDLLDLVRMTRALRPEGIMWPVDAEGKATNRLELITKLNKLDHRNAHDALSDVMATIALAKLIKTKQPKLFNYLLKMRDKKAVEDLVKQGKPFVYSSGKFSSEYEKTTVVVNFASHPKQGALVYDLRHDPTPFLQMSTVQLVEAWKWQPEPTELRLPVKTLRFNRCPAVAPLVVLEENDGWQKIKLDRQTVEKHLKILMTDLPRFTTKIKQALETMDKAQQQRFLEDEIDVDMRLYDGFIPDEDKTKMSVVRAAKVDELSELALTFKDARLQALLPLYKARNFPKTLTEAERKTWESFRERKLLGGKQSSRLAKYFARLAEVAGRPGLTENQRFLLEELQLYGQSIMPTDLDGE